MNVSELARKVKMNTKELLEILPELGFDIGRRAIKIDDRTANRIIEGWSGLMDQYKEKKRLEAEADKDQQAGEVKEITKQVKIPQLLTVREFARIIGLPVSKVISELMKNGVMASLNQQIDFDTAAIVAEDLGVGVELDEEVDQKNEVSQEEKIKELLNKDDKEGLKPRPPVVVVMGHVDHGKTKLLDAIRKTDVVAGEAGGITQHIGAYQVRKKDKVISFIDTPGHEAFTAMRSRGARIADIAILIVAADDGVKPQTIEAYNIIKSTNIPFVVAINKIDKPEANIDKTKQELSSQLNILPEDWGGKTVCVPISAKKEMNIDDLLDMILLVADVEKENIVANFDKSPVGTIIESHVDRGEGVVATILVQRGTLKVNDYLSVDGVLYGRIRAMKNHRGRSVEEATPSMPVKILGLKQSPEVGDIVEASKESKGFIKKKKEKRVGEKQGETAITQAAESQEENGIDTVNIILRADVLGSLEAIEESLTKIEHKEIKVKIIGKGLGNITETDILQAEAGQALVVGFNVMLLANVESLADEHEVEVKLYKVIYDLIDEMKKRMEEKLRPDILTVELGRLAILEVFRKEAGSMIIGGRVNKGKLESDCMVKVYRDDKLLAQGKLTQLQLGKQDVKEVPAGQECGAKFEGKSVIEKGDVLEAYKEEKVLKKLTG